MATSSQQPIHLHSLNRPAATPAYSSPSTPRQKRIPEWRYEGYRAFTTWLGSSDEAVVIRRFNKINARVIMYMQHEIGKKEERLDYLDNKSEEVDSKHNGSFELEHIPERTQILESLKHDLKEYSE